MSLMTVDGVLKGKTARRLPEDERYVSDEFEQLRGLSWNLQPPVALKKKDIIEDAETLRLPIYVPLTQPSQGVKQRRTYVLAFDVLKYGGSEGCPACIQVIETGRSNATHSPDERTPQRD